MTRTLKEAQRWSQEGSKIVLDAAAGLTEAAYAAPSLLPDWTRRHVVAHLAANADALGNLAHWAATGVETPMYDSVEERAAGIERGFALAAADLSEWLRRSTDHLETAMSELTDQQWTTEIRTAQGRLVPATEIPWLRAREVWVHAVDLSRGVSFSDVPERFLSALTEEIAAKRDLTNRMPDGPLPEVAAWLAGRPHALVGAPALGPWL